ncbi:ATP-binding cassette domain-containing protein [Streptomyces mirabilis]|uniref:ATP-binding cassette domain-containing protein n=1 Tax=Streptomyces mirabilis TaxID=68239 RepID=UPI00369EEBE4
MTALPAVVRVRGVTKSFGGAAALKGVDLDLYPGEVHALMGMNGAGKSTLVQILSGVHQPDGGTIEVNGGTYSGLTVRRARRLGIASVPQRRELAMGLTVAENVMLGDLPTRRGTVHWKAVNSEARKALSRLGIDIDEERTARSLTVAEQTMVEVAREVRRGGRILILDEPTACLSAEAAHQIRDLVRTLRGEGVAVVYISHYIDEVMAVADRLTVLRDGDVVRSAPAGDLDPAGLVRSMVGRDVVSRRVERAAPKDDIGLAVHGLSDGRTIRDFTVEVRKGEIVAVLGPAGDAQSRLFDLLSGRRRPDLGTVLVDGTPVPAGRRRRPRIPRLRAGVRRLGSRGHPGSGRREVREVRADRADREGGLSHGGHDQLPHRPPRQPGPPRHSPDRAGRGRPRDRAEGGTRGGRGGGGLPTQAAYHGRHRRGLPPGGLPQRGLRRRLRLPPHGHGSLRRTAALGGGNAAQGERSAARRLGRAAHRADGDRPQGLAALPGLSGRHHLRTRTRRIGRALLGP